MNILGFTEELIIAEAYRSLNDVYENRKRLKHSTLSSGFLKVFQWKMDKMEKLPEDQSPVYLHPEPHLLSDVLDASYNWGRLLGDRLCLVRNKDKHWEEPLDDYNDFPIHELEEARESRDEMIYLMDDLLELITENQLSMLEYVQTVEEMAEGVVLRELLETALPIEAWVETVQDFGDMGDRYQTVRELYDAINYMNRTARRIDPENRFYYTYRWPRLSIPLQEYRILN